VSVYYLDSSAWVKRYFKEPGSTWIARLFERNERLASTGLGYVEVMSALVRQQLPHKFNQRKLKQLQELLQADWEGLTGVPLTNEIMEQSVSLAQLHRLRGADAIHLAAALSLKTVLTGTKQTVILITSDQELLQAAKDAGLKTTDPIAAERQ
jgi:uncharacterized protein